MRGQGSNIVVNVLIQYIRTQIANVKLTPYFLPLPMNSGTILAHTNNATRLTPLKAQQSTLPYLRAATSVQKFSLSWICIYLR